MLKKIIMLYLVLIATGIASAQDAKELYSTAKTAMNEGNTQKCLAYLERCQQSLGGSNSRIESLKCQALAINSDWVNAAIAYENYDRMLPSYNRSGDAYDLMLDTKKQIWNALEEMEKAKKEEEEKEIKQDLASAEAESQQEEARIDTKQRQINETNENSLYTAAMDSKDPELLTIYKFEIGTSGDSYNEVSKEIDKQQNPDLYIVEAVQKNDVSEVTYLISHGANKNKTDSNRNSLLHIAVSKSSGPMTDYLLSIDAAVDARNSIGETPLIWAINSRYYKGAQKLLDKGANANTRNAYDVTALQYCLQKNEVGFAEMLIKKGVDVNAPITANGVTMTPVFYAVFVSAYDPMASKLLELGANANNYSNTNWTPLIAAVYKGDVTMTNLLLDNNVQINQKGPHGWTALHVASRNRNTAIIHLLKVKGADTKAKDEWKRTALKIAKQRRYKETIKALKS